MRVTADEVIQLGERQDVEFKKSLSLRKEGLEALCAMLNTDAAAGTVIFGVSPVKTIVGVEPGDPDSAQRSLSSTSPSEIRPSTDRLS